MNTFGVNPLLKALGRRQRDRHLTDVRQFHGYVIRDAEKADDLELAKLDLPTVFAYFQLLEKRGYGKVLPGQGRKRPTRFHWHYSIKSVVEALRTGDDSKLRGFNTKPGSRPAARKPVPAPAVSQMRTPRPERRRATLVVIALRPDLTLKFELPENFEMSDINLIDSALKLAIS